MPAIKRFDSALSCYIPPGTKAGIRKVAEMEGLTQSEAARTLLADGLKARGIEA